MSLKSDPQMVPFRLLNWRICHFATARNVCLWGNDASMLAKGMKFHGVKQLRTGLEHVHFSRSFAKN